MIPHPNRNARLACAILLVVTSAARGDEEPYTPRVEPASEEAARAIAETIARLHDRGVVVLLAGPQPRHRRLLTHLTGAGGLPSADRIHPDVASALRHARALTGSPARPSP